MKTMKDRRVLSNEEGSSLTVQVNERMIDTEDRIVAGERFEVNERRRPMRLQRVSVNEQETRRRQKKRIAKSLIITRRIVSSSEEKKRIKP